MPFPVPAYGTGSHVTFSWRVFLTFSRLWQVFSLPLTFRTFTLLENTRQLCFRMSFNWDLSNDFFKIGLRLCILTRITQKWYALLSASYRGTWCQYVFLLITDYHLVKMVSAGFLHCKVTFFSFVINKYLGRNTLELCKYPVSPQTFNH